MRYPTPQRLVQVVLLIALSRLLIQQVQQFSSERLLTMTSRRRGKHPRLTICPMATAPMHLLALPLQRLANKSISITEFFDTATIKLLGEAGTTEYRSRTTSFSDITGPGIWREKYYWLLPPLLFLGSTRCITFEAKEMINKAGSRRRPTSIVLITSPLFDGYDRFLNRASYRLFVHGEEVPNVHDLPEWAPFSENVLLRSGEPVHYSISARRTERVSVRRRPCSSQPGYSKAQCLKECRWRRLVKHTGCRLPHMVGTEVFLPDIGGFMDHLPLCSRMLSWEHTPLKMLNEWLSKNPCMKPSKEHNLTRLDEEFLLYLSQRTVANSSAEQEEVTANAGCNVQLTSFNSNRNSSESSETTSLPPSKPTPVMPSQPQRPPLAQPPNLGCVVLPAEAFSILPVSAFESE